MKMQRLIITIETSAEVTKDELTALGFAATDYTMESLKPHWHGAVVQSSKVEVTDFYTQSKLIENKETH